MQELLFIRTMFQNRSVITQTKFPFILKKLYWFDKKKTLLLFCKF